MKVIVVFNGGSTSIKYKIFSTNLRLIKQGAVTNLPADNLSLYKKGIKKAFKEIFCFKKDIILIGHRVVHGGEKFTQPILIKNNKTIKELAKYNHLAPLHNPFNIAILRQAYKYFPKALQVAVFDTGFFANLPEEAKIYGLPPLFLKKFKIQRFGFHGLSHEYALNQACKKLSKNPKKINLITAHLGGGTSICAIKKGKAIDISMGFTPLEGPLMMRRAGSLDPGIIFYLLKSGYKAKELEKIVNFESGFFGYLKTDDFQEVLKKVKSKDKKATCIFNAYIYQIQKYIGAYYVLLKHIDAIIFTGAIGSGDPYTRRKICQNIEFLKKIPVLSIKSNEELLVAQKAKQFLK